jgi:hypothetical protein
MIYSLGLLFCGLVFVTETSTGEFLTFGASLSNRTVLGTKPDPPHCDDAIDDRAKALFFAAIAKRDAVQRIEIEAVIEFKQSGNGEPFHYQASEQTVIDRTADRAFFQQEKKTIKSSQGSRSELARILIRDGIRYQKLHRNRDNFTVETVKSDLLFGSMRREIGMENIFLLGLAANPQSDFGTTIFEELRDFRNVASLKLGKSIDHEGTVVQELIFRISFADNLNVWVDPKSFRIHKVDTPGVHVISSYYETGNETVFPNRVEVSEFENGLAVRERIVTVTRIELDKEFQDEDFSIQRIKPVLNDYVNDYDQQRIVGRWNGYSYLGEKSINSPTVEAAITEQRLAGQASTPWLTYVIWAATAIVAIYLLVRLTRPRSE